MTIATTEEKQLTEFAEHVYQEQNEDFVKDLSERIKNSIGIGMAQVEDGEFMSLEKSKQRLYKELFSKSKTIK